MDLKEEPDSSLDSVILLQDEEKKVRKNCSNRNRPPKQKPNPPSTEKKPQANNRNRSKHISQEICVEKQKFKCIINLNTTVCGHKTRHRKCCERRHSKKHSYEERRHTLKGSVPHHVTRDKYRPKESISHHSVRDKHSIVPKCLRQNCANSTWNKRRRHQDTFKRSDPSRRNVKYAIGKNESDYEEIRRSIHEKYKHSSCIDHKKNPRILLSPISSSPLKVTDNDISYEDISNTSIDIYLDKPKLSKHRKHNKHTNAGHQESKLDTLIKRTKERERQLVEQFRFRSFYQPLRTSTPVHEMHEDLSSGDLPMSCSDMDISFNSQSTLVLDSRGLPYSPSCPIEEIYLNGDTVKANFRDSRGYSPSSPPRTQDYKLKASETNDFKLMSIKTEPAMDIEAYSPTHCPDMFLSKYDFPKGCVEEKVKVETESVVSSTLSPIYYEDNLKTCLQICKIESIKSEID